MVIATTIDVQDSFRFYANIAFDLPIAGLSMSLVEYSGDEEGDSELIARQQPLTSIANDKEDQTFATAIKRVAVDPSQSDDANAKYMFLLYEEQATYIFSEVAKVADSSNLCLPLSLEMQVKRRGRKATPWAHQEAKSVSDFRFMMNSAKGDPNHMVVPYGIKNIDVAVLFTSEPLDGEALMNSRPFSLSLFANDRKIEAFLPINIETRAQGQQGEQHIAVASFKPNLNAIYNKIRLATELRL